MTGLLRLWLRDCCGCGYPSAVDQTTEADKADQMTKQDGVEDIQTTKSPYRLKINHPFPKKASQVGPRASQSTEGLYQQVFLGGHDLRIYRMKNRLSPSFNSTLPALIGNSINGLSMI